MPPKRCPECGRFLSNALVASSAVEPVPCPRCGTLLEPDIVAGRGSDWEPADEPEPADADAASPADTDADAASPADADADGSSVRPPDLDPASVRTSPENVLDGWDVGASGAEVASWRRDRRPFPVDTVVVAGAAVAGAAVGAALSHRHRVAWSAGASLAGAVTAGAARRIWELRM